MTAPPGGGSSAEATPSRLSRLMDEHPALLLTAGYLILTLVGLIYEFWLFLLFRINIVDWAESSDFLLAAVRTPLIILSVFFRFHSRSCSTASASSSAPASRGIARIRRHRSGVFG